MKDITRDIIYVSIGILIILTSIWIIPLWIKLRPIGGPITTILPMISIALGMAFIIVGLTTEEKLTKSKETGVKR